MATIRTRQRMMLQKELNAAVANEDWKKEQEIREKIKALNEGGKKDKTSKKSMTKKKTVVTV